MYPVLHHQQAFRLDKTVEIKNYFIGGIIEREMVSKYIASFNYFDKSWIVFSGTSGRTSIASFVTIIGAPVIMASANFSFGFSITSRKLKKYWK